MRNLVLLSLLLGGCSSSSAEDSSTTCGIDATADNPECPVDDCAADCTALDEAVACCLAAHPRGLESARALDDLAATCSGAACDPTQYISEAGAVCLAQAHGLEAGVGWCGGAFMGTGDDFQWSVVNTEAHTVCPDGESYTSPSGRVITLDALTGTRLDTGRTDYSSLGACP